MVLHSVTRVFILRYPTLYGSREINVAGGSHSPNLLLLKMVKSCHMLGANPLI